MKTLVGLTTIVLAFGGCKSETARKADNAAENVQEQRKDLNKAQAKLDDERKDIAGQKKEMIDESKNIAKQGAELAKAESEFEFRRMARVNTMRAELAVLATQPNLISTMSQNFALTDAGRVKVNEKLALFQMRLDETRNLIEGLMKVDAAQWTARHDAVRDAMKKLDDARDEAWDALEDAPRVAPPAS